MKNPLVSVICLCYNQARFIQQALDSVMCQTYRNIELIILDDASTDDSESIIDEWVNNHKGVLFIRNETNKGSTKSFNKALTRASGAFIIDLAGDDILLPERIENQISFFEKQSENVGVIYSNAQYIDESGNDLDVHFDRPRMTPFSGDVYCKLIDTYFIPTPTMMIRKRVLDQLGGYDEELSYEDFDFWVRSARTWEYAYQSEITTLIRKSSHSQSSNWYVKGDSQLYSTYLVCRKIHHLNRTKEENLAFTRRLRFELRQSFFSDNHREFDLFFDLWSETGKPSRIYRLLSKLNKLHLNLSKFRLLYHRLRYG